MKTSEIGATDRREYLAALARDRLQLLIAMRALVDWFFSRSQSSQRRMSPARWVRARALLDRIEKERGMGPKDSSMVEV